jgi:hypothetical protein
MTNFFHGGRDYAAPLPPREARRGWLHRGQWRPRPAVRTLHGIGAEGA